MRFAGTIEEFADVDVDSAIQWLRTVPVEEWRALANPADLSWGYILSDLAEDLTATYYPGCIVSGLGMFPLYPGQEHRPHTDEQPPYYVVRVHVPLVTNPYCFITMHDGDHYLSVGKAYKFNTEITHGVYNHGDTHRVHFMFDIRTP
jgi:hypothetical protein